MKAHAVDPLVSVIMPVYNYGAFIQESLQSLLKQTYTNWECLIVDDGSTDDTHDVVAEFVKADNRFIYIYQDNAGVSAARNRALKQSKGKYIQLLDADDLLEKEKLEYHVSFLESSPEIDLVYGDVLLFENCPERNRAYRPFQLPGSKPVSGRFNVVIDNLLWDNFFLISCVLSRREVFDRVGGFAVGIHGLEDWNFWYRAALSGFSFEHYNASGTHALIRAHASSSSKKQERMLKGKIAAREEILNQVYNLQSQKNHSLTPEYIYKIIKQHASVLHKHQYEYQLQYGNLLSGIASMFKYAFVTKRFYFTIYDAAHYIKKRVRKKS